MAITITAKLNADGVKTGAAQVGDALEGMANQGAQSTDKLDQVAKELFDQLGDLKGRTEALQGELASMAASGVNALGRVEDAAEGAGDAVGSIGAGGSALEAVTAVATGYLALVDIAGKFVEAGAKAVEVVNMLAEQGNPAAMELSDSFGEVKASLLSVAEDPIFQEWMSEIAEQINETVVPAIKAIPDALVSIGDAFEDASLRRADTFFGELTKKAEMASPALLALNKTLDAVFGAGPTDEEIKKQRQYRDELREQSKALVAREKEIQEAKERTRKAEEDLEKLEDRRRHEREEAALKMIEDETELIDIIERETKAIKERAYQGKLTDKEREEGIRRIESAENRLKEVRQESADAEKRGAEESARASQESVKQAESAAKERERIAKEEADRKQQIAREALEQERRNIEERKRLVMGGDVKGAEQILGSQTREQVREAYARQQSEGASLAATFSGMSEKEVARERQRALANARRQFDRGQADPADIRNAQVELAGQSVDLAAKQGAVSKETAQALKESTAELARTQNELGQLQAEVENVRRMQQSIIQGANRRRAQVAGGRQ